MPLIVFTGASGAGKTSVKDALAAKGFRTQPEIGRVLVQEQLASNGSALPWADKVAFRDLLFIRSIEAFDSRSNDSEMPLFFDRSFLDAVAYSSIIGVEVTGKIHEEATRRRFDDPVFVFPPWEDIFAADRERRHGFDDAVQDYEANIAAYREAGYRLVEVPRMSIAQRADFVIQTVSESQTQSY